MTHPHHLHAMAAAWSLAAARTVLAAHAAREAARNGAELVAAASVLRSPVWGNRSASGDHGDPVGAAILSPRPAQAASWSDRLDRLDHKLSWLASQLGTPPRRDPLARITAAIPRLQPGTVAVLVRHLVDEDRWVREALQLGTEGTLLAGTECPVCGQRPLRLLPTGPTAGVVVCTAGCRCVGARCRCGMLGAVEGVAHIWQTARDN